jgi:hypothetical protein
MSEGAGGSRSPHALRAMAELGRLRGDRKGDTRNLNARCALVGTARKDARP